MLEGLLDPLRWEMTFSQMDTLWQGFSFTLQVVVAGLLLSIVLGTILGVFSTTRSRVLRAISRVYVEFYQNTPLPVQVFFMYAAGPKILQALTGASSAVRIAPFVLGFVGGASTTPPTSPRSSARASRPCPTARWRPLSPKASRVPRPTSTSSCRRRSR